MSIENNDKKPTPKGFNKKEKTTLASLAGKAATFLRSAEASTMEAARIIRDTFDRFDGLTYAAWRETMATMDAETLTETRVSQYRAAAKMETLAGTTLTSERQARDLRAALKGSGVDMEDAKAVADAIASGGGVDAVVKAGRKAAATVKPKASKADPKPEPKAEAKAEAKADPAAYLHDAVSVAIRAAGSNREMLDLLASTMEEAAKGIRASLAKEAAPIGKAKRKVVATA
jgi:hypothetical protein